MTDKIEHVKEISKESLDIFYLISDTAKLKSQFNQGSSAEAFASINTFTGGGKAVNKLNDIHSKTQVEYR